MELRLIPMNQLSKQNIIGNRYGRLVVIEKDKKAANGTWQYKCQCDCGNTTSTKKTRLTQGITTSCGCSRFTLAEAIARNNLHGKVIGRLTVLKKINNDRHGNVRWRCQCSCGKITTPRASDLYAGKVSSCGCQAIERSVEACKINLQGKTFGRLTVISESSKRDSSGNVYWHCLCECGAKKVVAGRLLRNGDVVSCGCYQKEIAGKYQQYDLTGMKFGRLTVIQLSHTDKTFGSFWHCQCQCGNRHIVRQNSLVTGATRSCGCLNHDTEQRRSDLKGQTFGRLKVLAYAGAIESGDGGALDATWLCRCQCDTEKVIRSRCLKDGSTLSCGCYIREQSTTHGLSQTKTYKSAQARKRAISKTQRTPKWADNNKILRIYQDRPSGYHVDHIIPLHSKLVCGLHVEGNLQYLTAKENLAKSNSFDPETYKHEY